MPEYVEGLTLENIEVFWAAMNKIEAQNALTQMKIDDYSRMKQNAREKFHRDMYFQAFPEQRKCVTILPSELKI